MSTEKKPNGGYAFPCQGVFEKVGNFSLQHASSEGMTMRQYYAAHAPITIDDARDALYGRRKEWEFPETFKLLSQMRFDYADAMIAEENKT